MLNLNEGIEQTFFKMSIVLDILYPASVYTPTADICLYWNIVHCHIHCESENTHTDFSPYLR